MRKLLGRMSPRGLALPALGAVVAVAAPAAALSGAASQSSDPSPGPGLVDVGEPCVDRRKRTLDTTTNPAPAEVTQLLSVLRRPARPDDRHPNLDALAPLPVQGVNPDAIRLATAHGGRQVWLVPAENVRYFHPLPDTEACKRFREPDVKPAPGVCMLGRTGGAGGCSDVSAIRRGRTLLTSGGRRRGITRATGIAPDGVRAVIWRVRRGDRLLDTRIPARENVYAADLPSRAGRGLYVFFVTADGRKAVIAPHRMTPRERALRRRSVARDEAAGPTPSVFPAMGAAKTIFTLRVRVTRPMRGVYVARWIGPAGTPCATAAGNELGMVPVLRGERRGFMKAGFGPPAETGEWCPGAYTGTIRLRRSPGEGDGRLVGRFAYRVAAP